MVTGSYDCELPRESHPVRSEEQRAYRMADERESGVPLHDRKEAGGTVFSVTARIR